ncbi:hypothetical protein BWQ96_03469 [Gracilariopsis chorda]|uniref:Uncharacterized protein n=1 Tax=Gracilariopsis chorda TaxID=448386 RepID=A0A2V3IXA6_9FLOR|nr:hypothetical protein BWQ96_03469 [Gracilariopsis chorda]|eukprot:PXF46778.1 hypothetical protein BWQ96_03469 [Gracilariopsis chorda]
MPQVGENWVSPDTEFDHRRLPGRTPISRRRIVLPSPVDEYVAATAQRFDAFRFSAIPVRPSISYTAGNKRIRDGAWEARWVHTRIRVYDRPHLNAVRTELAVSFDMPWVRCAQDQDYQHRLAVIFSRLRNQYESKSDTEPFPPPCHNLLTLVAWRAPLDRFYLTCEREHWGDDISDEACIRSCHSLFVGWHNHGLDDLLRPKRQCLYLPVPQEERMFDVWRYLCVPTSPIAAYYSGVMLAERRLPSIACTVLQTEWAVSCSHYNRH